MNSSSYDSKIRLRGYSYDWMNKWMNEAVMRLKGQSLWSKLRHEHHKAKKAKIPEIDELLSEFYIWSRFPILHQHINQLYLFWSLKSPKNAKGWPPLWPPREFKQTGPPSQALIPSWMSELKRFMSIIFCQRRPRQSKGQKERRQVGLVLLNHGLAQRRREKERRGSGIWDVQMEAALDSLGLWEIFT